MHHWGISLPGACEGLCRWRGTVEPVVANGTLEQLVAYLDLVNMFGNAEWPCIPPGSCARTFPEASAWTEWQLQSESVISLPSGATFATNWVELSRVMCWAPSRVRWS